MTSSKLTEKEKNYLRKVLLSSNDMGADAAIYFLNSKRQASGEADRINPEEVIDFLSNALEDNPDLQDIDEQVKLIRNYKTEIAEEANAAEIQRTVSMQAEALAAQLGPALSASKPKLYTIVSGKTQAVLAGEVNSLIKKGWVPLGGGRVLRHSEFLQLEAISTLKRWFCIRVC